MFLYVIEHIISVSNYIPYGNPLVYQFLCVANPYSRTVR